MGSGRTVPPRLAVLKLSGTPERSASGLVDWPSKAVGASREPMASWIFGSGELRRVDGQEKPMAELCGVRTANRHRWARRVASGARVKRGQGTRHNDPVTSEEGMHALVKASRRQPGCAAVNRLKRLFSKNTGACQAA